MDASQGEVPEEDASFQLDIYSRAIDRPACRPRNHAEHAQRQKSLSLPVPVYAPGLRQDRPGATAPESDKHHHHQSANMSVPSSKLTARPVAGGGGAVGEDAVAGEAGAVASVGNRQAPSGGDMMRQAAAAEMPVGVRVLGDTRAAVHARLQVFSLSRSRFLLRNSLPPSV